MKQNIKKILMLLMMAGLTIPVINVAAEGNTEVTVSETEIIASGSYETTSGTAEWTVDSAGTLKVRGGEMRGISDWKEYAKQITTLDIKVERLGYERFANNFDYPELKHVYLSVEDGSDLTDLSYMFSICSNLETIEFGKFDTSRVTSMKEMFKRCRKLRHVNVEVFDTSNVTDMGYMFGECESLEKLDVSGFDTSKVTDMHYMFAFCEPL